MGVKIYLKTLKIRLINEYFLLIYNILPNNLLFHQ